MRLSSLAFLSFVTIASLARADDPAPPAADSGPRTGQFQLRIPERSKSSAILPMTARLGWGSKAEVEAAAKKDGGEVDYNLSNETFEVFVPEDYKGDEPYGLLVWISAGPGGGVHREWLDVLRKHKLVWIGANNSGNNRTRWVRLGLAIDAADYMQKAYKIDPHRVYVSGGSGGGRCASTVAFGFPEVFTGGAYPIIGCNFYRVVEAGPGEDGRPKFYLRGLNRPAGKLFNLIQKERRFVLLTGDNDPNQPQTKLYYDAMKKDGFKYVTYIQVPGMGHQTPNAEWFEKGIVALDEPRDAVAAAQPAPQEKAVPAASAAPPATPARAPAEAKASPDDEADKLMRLAKLYVSNRLYNKAREKLNQVVKDYPASPHATEAKKLLKEIGSK
jgi:hypothetical protein